jgi:cytochrome c5
MRQFHPGAFLRRFPGVESTLNPTESSPSADGGKEADMKLVVVGVMIVACCAAPYAWSTLQQSDDKPKAAEENKAPAETSASVNPVKSSPEGLAEARKVYGYDCEMCHGQKGDGKGDVVESMKLEMHDWHEATTLAGKTDGELFSIITKGKGKMMGEGDRVPQKLRWNLVNLVRSMAAKSSDQKSAASSTSTP